MGERSERLERAMRLLPVEHMESDEVAQVECIISAAHARIDAAVAAKRAAWEALRAKNGGGVYRETDTYTGSVKRETPVAVLRFTKTLIITVKEPTGLRDGGELRFSAATGGAKWKILSFTGPRRELVLDSASDRVKAVVAATADHKDARWGTAWREAVAALPASGAEPKQGALL